MPVFRVEKTKDYTVMSNHHLRNTALSLKAKGLLSLMLSLPESWDFTLRGLTKISADGIDGIRAAVNELEQHGYLIRRRLRNEKGQLADTEYTILEQQASEKPTLENPILEKPMQLNTKKTNTEKINTKVSNIHPSVAESTSALKLSKQEMSYGGDTKQAEACLETIKSNIEYDLLCSRYDKGRLDEIVGLILETLCSQRENMYIAGEELKVDEVKKRFLQLDLSHIEYIFDSMNSITSKVSNMRGYLRAMLYNAPVTIDHYYAALVRHDLYGSK